MKHEMKLRRKNDWFAGPRSVRLCAHYFHANMKIPKQVNTIYIVFYSEKPRRDDARTFKIKNPEYCYYPGRISIKAELANFRGQLLPEAKRKLAVMHKKGYRYIQVEWEE